ncbi:MULTISPECIES: phosphoserine phosphatase SerB [unclassified Cupriavidus]|jgi:phosphoserine phosphatase|uniref:phosphoserine phosphatase SerB n=1 Tax=unclassified Cupriavidus TaxID=2640874 RepID=UPI001C005775|nr:MULTISPECIES: phosphoserine phosphatase SerB [unclassified Cupriavidus]MCA3183212.1 phosphoserine phosphatase SerB [Cupriavidus sp.]MCA3189410.1 phosphoserine phosphatase SerB [Cupriavidus sp.]MCA3195490.1 phosphoserine phosphatase SerB [Cupriavidus sp.]MCA3201045.1 phosphoserine phosphatase SerB [Cupriavidus sp.]MCA3232055.1 phosphoserine phosphatase SerB [Cupriavidus sp.]
MPLILQSLSPLSAADLDAVRTVANAPDLALRTDNVAAAEQCNPLTPALRDALDDVCGERGIDWAVVPAGRKLSDFRLVAMDMDSTLITIECIDEIADFCGLKAEVSAITEAAMRGEITDFNESLRRRVALLKGLDASVLDRVYAERLKLSPGAERMLQTIQALGMKTLLVSGGFVHFTDQLKPRLKLDFTRANTLEIVDGKLTGNVVGEIVNADVKARTVREVCEQIGADPSQAIVMGDGSNDLKMMAVAGLSVAFRAKPVVRAQASVAFNHVGLDGLLNLFPH